MAKKLDDLLKDFEKEAEQAVSSNSPLWEGGKYDDITKLAVSFGAKALANIIYLEDGSAKSPVLKFVTEEQAKQIQDLAGDDAVVDIDLNTNFAIDKDNLEDQIDDAKDQLSNELSDPLEISVDLALDELDNWIEIDDDIGQD